MLQEVLDLQNRAVSDLCRKTKGQREVVFRAPTGSGKTHMMADYMNRMLEENPNIIFLVSTLSKGGLGEQNYESFVENSRNGNFPNLKPHLISTDISGEESLFIPTDCNVYVLARDLFKKNGKLMAGPMISFLRTMKENFFGDGKGKHIVLIKDECHQKTNNLDAISDAFFEKIINFSATPKMSRGQVPDVVISDEEAVLAKLIKKVEWGNDSDTVEDALNKYQEIKEKYTSLGVNPCLIIQISNKDKAEQEWQNNIKPALDKHQDLKWMVLVDTKGGAKKEESLCDTNDAIRNKLPVSRWKDYAKGANSTINVIIFKMVISEGWDIPRACMLYQVRDTQSKQLDEQVMGRVRRNPRLLDFERLSDEEKQLAMTAWVWGIAPESMKQMFEVNLLGTGTEIQQNFRIKPIKLATLTEKKNFNIDDFLSARKEQPTGKSIFVLYNKLMKNSNNEIQNMCYQYASEDLGRWFKFTENLDEIKKEYDTYICDYEQSMQVAKETSLPYTSLYADNGNNNDIDDWVWVKKNNTDNFAFDSEAERQWASKLKKLSRKFAAEIDNPVNDDEEVYLWGKNFPENSEIKYEYYTNGVHASYPDFVLKDTKGRIHLFEVKSVNGSSGAKFDPEEYKEKINQLKKCYKACSKKLSNHLFYLPILDGSEWHITRFVNGVEDIINFEQFKESLKQ